MNKNFLKTLLFFSVLWLACLSGQAFPQTLPPNEAGDIDISREAGILKIDILTPGGKSYQGIIPILPVKEGEPLTRKSLRDSIRVLYETGLFSQITVSVERAKEGAFLKFTVTEKIKADRLIWSGNRDFSKKQLEESSKFTTGAELVSGWESTLKDNLLNMYHNEGYFRAEVIVDSTSSPLEGYRNILVKISEGERSTLDEIEFTGNPGLSPETLLDTLRINSGFYYSLSFLKSRIDELYPFYEREGFYRAKIGNFSVKRKEGEKEDIEIPVEAGPLITVGIKFKGKSHFLPATLKKIILVRPEKSFEDFILEESARKLKEFYRDAGYPFTEVRVEKAEEKNGKSVRITFQIEEGPQVALTRVLFRGNQSVPTEILSETVSHHPSGFWIPNFIHLGEIPDDIEALKNVYKSRGFLFTVITEEIRYGPDRQTAELEFTFAEGVKTFVGEVTIEGFSPAFAEEIQSKLKVRKGDHFNQNLVSEDKSFINSYYHKKGYADLKVEANYSLNEQKDLAAVNYKAEEGPVVHIGAIRLTGNEMTESRIILREVTIKTGDLYQEEALFKNQRLISQLGLFQKVNIHPLSRDPLRDVEITVKERMPGAFEFGPGYGDVERLNGFAQISYQNLGGTDRKVTLRADVSQLGHKEMLTYLEPWVFNYPVDARSSISYGKLFIPAGTYTQEIFQVSVGVEKNFQNYYKGALSYQIEIVHNFDVPFNIQLTPEDQDVNIFSLNPSIIRDTRDDFLNPASGSLNGAWFRWAAQFMGSEIQEVKLNLQSSWFFNLGHGAVMALSGRAGAANNFGETPDVPLVERFRLGGITTVRGYAQDTLGIMGQTLNPDFTPKGGNFMILFNWEVRKNLPKSFGLVFFVDSGQVYRYLNTTWSAPLKTSVGPGLRYNTPIGPIRFDVGFKLNPEEGESGYALHFTVGHAF
ncbi:MAG TPA: outer membrane protein assembly factor BamA [Nitrospiria bacterium]|nr:outer membrane protein assembly factor BamA [Nitrospiria bacterium]